MGDSGPTGIFQPRLTLLIAISRSLAGFSEVQFGAQKTEVIGATKFGRIKHMFLRKLRICSVGRRVWCSVVGKTILVG